ncbi:MAG: F0F1 ATP synthase subunit epsilon [Pseudomonadota bacterium]
METPLRLRVITPTEVVLDDDVVSVVAEDASGAFGIWARHEVMAAVLVPGIMRCRTAAGKTMFIAVDRGVLEKEGGLLRVAVRRAVVSEDYRQLEDLLRRRLAQTEESEAAARDAFSRLSLSVMQRLLGLFFERGGR